MPPLELNAAAPDELQRHITGAYLNLRRGMGLIALFFPPVLALGGWIRYDLTLLGSMSAYYHSEMRNVFVGVLCAIGAFLYLYKGFSKRENSVLNVAGLCAVGIAMFPTRMPDASRSVTSVLHGVFAVLFFLCIAYVCIRRASDTLPLVRDAARVAWYSRAYQLLGAGMILSPVSAALLMLSFQRGEQSSYVFYIELVGVWTFAVYWLVKSREIQETHADRQVAEGQIERDDRGNLLPEGVVSARAARPRAPLPERGDPSRSPAGRS